VGLEQLFPERREVEVGEAYAELDLHALAPPSRPYVVANMISSADGRATLHGKTRALSSEVDRELFLELRTQVDAVMVGPATIAIEGYGPLLRSQERRERRRERALEPVPLAVTPSRTMELPAESPLFQDPDSRIVVLTNSDRPAPPAPAQVVVERIPGPELDFARALELLRSKHGIRSVLLEGGPTLLAAMVSAKVVDELFLTIAAKLVGGDGEISPLEGYALAAAADLTLESVLREGSYMYLRYAIGLTSS
jgi:riboflavin-specific deaminase-like protein